MRLPGKNSPASYKVVSNPKFFPFFENADGAIDCTHFPAAPPEEQKAAHRDRDGNITTNCLAVCDFEMKFMYMQSGWEGSASDSLIFTTARGRDLKIRKGHYLLADAGFPGCDQLLVPYRGVRYHLREWGAANLRWVQFSAGEIYLMTDHCRPKDHKELFNLRHSQLRNIVEQIFGVAKKKFKMLCEPTDYPLITQIRIQPAIGVLMNFIGIHDPDDVPDGELSQEGLEDLGEEQHSRNEDELSEEDLAEQGGIGREESERASDLRDQIALAMWNSYQAEVQRRRA
jgi:hypothetical protein